jgi:membrane-associated protease RseP (regulator of RpoE activity)
LDEKGVLIDEVTLAAADSGLRGKDIIKSVNGVQVTNINEFYASTKNVKNLNTVAVEVKRDDEILVINLSVPDELGFAQLESAPMILPGAIPPHRFRGPCTDCHAIGYTGHITPDPDMVTLVPPPISMMTKCPHRYRGECTLCHVIK